MMRKTFFGRSVRAAQYKQATVFLEPAVQCSRIVSRWGTREDDRARELYITATTVASQHCSCTRRTTETTSLCQKFSKLWTNSVYCLQTEADNSHGITLMGHPLAIPLTPKVGATHWVALTLDSSERQTGGLSSPSP